MIPPESLAKDARVHKPTPSTVNSQQQQFTMTVTVDPAAQKNSKNPAVAPPVNLSVTCRTRLGRLT